MASTSERYEVAAGHVIVSLSEQIFWALRSKSLEERQPTRNADESDDFIKDLTQRIETLTRIRSEYEFEMSRSLTL